MSEVAETLPSSFSLPLFITRENKYPVGLALAAIAAVLYLSCNHFHFYPPVFLTRTWVDLAIPFMPNTVWIYSSEYVYFPIVYIVCRDMTNLNKYFYSFLALQLVSSVIFWAWPTTFPRDLFPLPADLNFPTHYLFSSLRQTDTPANCCPSLHVSSVFLSAFIFLDEQRKLFPFYFLWAVSIAVTTLTTKQHYLVDVVSGFMMAVVFYWGFHRWVGYRKIENSIVTSSSRHSS
jgi:membrane-associated phospholipid phosphatase